MARLRVTTQRAMPPLSARSAAALREMRAQLRARYSCRLCDDACRRDTHTPLRAAMRHVIIYHADAAEAVDVLPDVAMPFLHFDACFVCAEVGFPRGAPHVTDATTMPAHYAR